MSTRPKREQSNVTFTLSSKMSVTRAMPKYDSHQTKPNIYKLIYNMNARNIDSINLCGTPS